MKKLILYCLLIFSFTAAKADPVITAFTATPSDGNNIRITGNSLSVNFYLLVARSYPPQGGSSFEPGTITLRLVYKTSSGQIEPITDYKTYNAADYKNGAFLDIYINNIVIPSSNIGKTLTVQYSYWSSTAGQTLGPMLLGGYYGIVSGGNTTPDTVPISSMPLSIISKIDNAVNVFATNTDGYVMRKWFYPSTGGWSAWENFSDKKSLYQPVAITKDNQTMDIYIIGEDNKLYQKWWSASAGWSAWQDFGGSFAARPSVLSKDGGQTIDVFAVGTDQHLYHRYWNSAEWNSSTGGWSAWRDFGGNFASSAPVAISKDNGNSIDVWAVGSDNHLYQKWWNKDLQNNSSGGWSAWMDHGGSFASSPGILSKDAGQTVDIFIIGTDNHLHHRYWSLAEWNSSTGGWSAWRDFGGSFASSPAAVSKDGGQTINVMATGVDGHLYQKWWNSAQSNNSTGGWSSWEDLGGSLASPPAIVSRSSQTIDVFAKGTTNSLLRKAYSVSSGWSGWQLVSGTN